MTTNTNKEKGKAGRPPGSTQKSSQLKPVLGRLKRLSTKALDNIQLNVEGKVIDKDVLASSKWVVNTLTAVHKAVLAEEEGIKSKDDDSSDEKEENTSLPANFTLKQVK